MAFTIAKAEDHMKTGKFNCVSASTENLFDYGDYFADHINSGRHAKELLLNIIDELYDRHTGNGNPKYNRLLSTYEQRKLDQFCNAAGRSNPIIIHNNNKANNQSNVNNLNNSVRNFIDLINTTSKEIDSDAVFNSTTKELKDTMDSIPDYHKYSVVQSMEDRCDNLFETDKAQALAIIIYTSFVLLCDTIINTAIQQCNEKNKQSNKLYVELASFIVYNNGSLKVEYTINRDMNIRFIIGESDMVSKLARNNNKLLKDILYNNIDGILNYKDWTDCTFMFIDEMPTNLVEFDTSMYSILLYNLESKY